MGIRYVIDQQDYFLNLDPTIDKNGNVYFGYLTIYSIDYTGKLRWKYEVDGHNNYSPLILIYQVIFLLNWKTIAYYRLIITVLKTGSFKWKVKEH